MSKWPLFMATRYVENTHTYMQRNKGNDTRAHVQFGVSVGYVSVAFAQGGENLAKGRQGFVDCCSFNQTLPGGFRFRDTLGTSQVNHR